MYAPESEDGGAVGRMLLAWSGRSATFALDAASILRVVEHGEWSGSEPYDLSRVLDLDESVEPVRVLEVQKGASRIGLLAFGAMRLWRVTEENLLDVPELLRAHGAGALFHQLAVVDGSPALWVLDTNAIHREAFVRCPMPTTDMLECVE
jgi:hypothetical protein